MVNAVKKAMYKFQVANMALCTNEFRKCFT